MDSKEFEHDDPMEFNAVALPGNTEAEMAAVFVEEFIKMGWPDDQILALFRNPWYGAAHAVWKSRGEEFVQGVISEARAAWGPIGRRASTEESHA